MDKGIAKAPYAETQDKRRAGPVKEGFWIFIKDEGRHAQIKQCAGKMQESEYIHLKSYYTCA
jgi:hypothetical protein